MAYATGADKMPHGVVTNPHIFVSIDKDGTVNIVAARAEMGTGAARTTLPMIVADELDADWARVRVVQSPGDEETYGNQDTDGSRSVRHFIQPMRQVGAGARQMLETAAAKRWNVACQRSPGAVCMRSCTRPRARSSATANSPPMRRHCRRRPLDTLRLKEPSAFRYIGKGNVQHRRSVRHHDRQGDLRPGREAPRHEVRGHRPVAGGRGQGGVLRLPAPP